MKISFTCYNSPLSLNAVNQRCGFKLKPALKHDEVCFRGKDLLDLPEQEVFDKIKASIKPENFLGHGTEAEVYRIKDTNYCVRIPYRASNISRFNYSKNLKPADKINHIVAKLGLGAAIMKYFEGVIPKWYENNNNERYKLQEKISEMPIKSYSEFLHQIAGAIDNEMLYDFSPGNLIVDTAKQKLTAIDFYPINEEPRPIHPMSEMYSVLTCYGSTEETGKKIFDNIVDAGLEEFKPNQIPCMDVALFDFVELGLRCKREKNTPVTLDIMNAVRFKVRSLQQIKKKEILDKTVSNLLEQKIKEVKNIMKCVR